MKANHYFNEPERRCEMTAIKSERSCRLYDIINELVEIIMDVIIPSLHVKRDAILSYAQYCCSLSNFSQLLYLVEKNILPGDVILFKM